MSIPRGSHPRETSLWTFFSPRFLSLLSTERSQIDSVLNPKWLSPSSFIFLTTPFILSSNSKPLFIYLFYRCYSFSSFFSLAATFTPTLALLTPALSASVEALGETNRYNAPTVLSRCISLALVSLLLIFQKFLPDTLEFIQCAHLPLKFLPSLLKLSPYFHLQITAKLKNLHFQK